MKPVDLHVHSIKSDGSLTPTELVDLALQKGLRAFALTDHDTIAGIEEAVSYAQDKDIEVIPGVELSTEYKGRDIHMVGLYVDCKDPEFLRRINNFRNARDLRNEEMCAKLRDEAGMDITYEALKASDPGAVITRSHYARYMLEHGYISSLPEAFDRYIGDHCKYFVTRKKITPSDAIQLILNAGGIPILAHPMIYGMNKNDLDELVALLKNDGLQGIEAIYSTYTAGDERRVRELADKYNLKISGGSDFHGKAKPKLELGTGYGSLFVPETVLDELISDRTK